MLLWTVIWLFVLFFWTSPGLAHASWVWICLDFIELKTNIYCGSGIPGSAFWWRSSQVSEYFIYISDFYWLHNMAGICMACFCVWAPYSDYCMVCFFRKVILKSDTAVALRRSISLIPCIIVVFSSTFIMSISVNWRGSLHNHRMF